MTKPGFFHCTPIFCTADLARSLVYYTDVLGWEISWCWSDEGQFEGGPPHFACVSRGDVSLFLGHQRQGTAGTWLHLNLASLEELETLHAEYRESGAIIVAAPTDCPWGLREMMVEDLDGNTLRIGAELSNAENG